MVNLRLTGVRFISMEQLGMSRDSTERWAATVNRLLLVEDNELNRDMLSRRLIRKGYEILIAVDGAEGVEIAQAERPDLILMDMSLPVMDGWEATQKIKGSESTRGIPVLGLSAHALSEERDRAMAAGCDDYDTKPVELPRLLEKIETLLQIKNT